MGMYVAEALCRSGNEKVSVLAGMWIGMDWRGGNEGELVGGRGTQRERRETGRDIEKDRDKP